MSQLGHVVHIVNARQMLEHNLVVFVVPADLVHVLHREGLRRSRISPRRCCRKGPCETCGIGKHARIRFPRALGLAGHIVSLLLLAPPCCNPGSALVSAIGQAACFSVPVASRPYLCYGTVGDQDRVD